MRTSFLLALVFAVAGCDSASDPPPTSHLTFRVDGEQWSAASVFATNPFAQIDSSAAGGPITLLGFTGGLFDTSDPTMQLNVPTRAGRFRSDDLDVIVSAAWGPMLGTGDAPTYTSWYGGELDLTVTHYSAETPETVEGAFAGTLVYARLDTTTYEYVAVDSVAVTEGSFRAIVTQIGAF